MFFGLVLTVVVRTGSQNCYSDLCKHLLDGLVRTLVIRIDTHKCDSGQHSHFLFGLLRTASVHVNTHGCYSDWHLQLLFGLVPTIFIRIRTHSCYSGCNSQLFSDWYSQLLFGLAITVVFCFFPIGTYRYSLDCYSHLLLGSVLSYYSDWYSQLSSELLLIVVSRVCTHNSFRIGTQSCDSDWYSQLFVDWYSHSSVGTPDSLVGTFQSKKSSETHTSQFEKPTRLNLRNPPV